MKLKEFIYKTVNNYLNENNIEKFEKIATPVLNNIKGRFLNKKQAEELQKEIESNYIDGDMMKHFNREKDDIRMNMFNYDVPIAQKTINGVDLRITQGLIRNNKKTYLLYANGKIIGEFYSVDDIKKIVKYIEDRLIKKELK